MLIKGIGVYALASSINHSCRPNAVVSFKGRELTIRAIRQIQSGEEITISYTDQLKSTWSRRLQLLRHYYFICHCERCSSLDINDSFLCLKCNSKPALCTPSDFASRQQFQSYSSGDYLIQEIESANQCIEIGGDAAVAAKILDFLDTLSIPFGDLWLSALRKHPQELLEFVLPDSCDQNAKISRERVSIDVFSAESSPVFECLACANTRLVLSNSSRHTFSICTVRRHSLYTYFFKETETIFLCH